MLKAFPVILLCVVFLSCKTTTVYISRHAEKAASPAADPPLTPEGERRALALRDYLKGKRLAAVYSTNYSRTKATAKPTADFYHLPVTVYPAATPGALLDSLKVHNRRNVLIVGHSNTVDDLVNRFVEANAVTDLPESEYGSLFIVRKKGKKYRFEKIVVPVDGQ